MKKATKWWVCLYVVGMLFDSVASANLIVNGSFEQGTARDSIFAYYQGDTGLSGWSVVGNIESLTSTFWQPSNGLRSLDLNGASTGGVSQIIATTPGNEYNVQFDMAGNPAGGPTIKSLKVSAAGQEDIFTFDNAGKTGANMGWATYNWTFVASSVSTTLAFTSLITGGAGPALDNVSVTPEPATMLLLGLGGMLLRKRKV
jgi:choice-of-anchor C domain-containing protein